MFASRFTKLFKINPQRNRLSLIAKPINVRLSQRKPIHINFKNRLIIRTSKPFMIKSIGIRHIYHSSPNNDDDKKQKKFDYIEFFGPIAAICTMVLIVFLAIPLIIEFLKVWFKYGKYCLEFYKDIIKQLSEYFKQ